MEIKKADPDCEIGLIIKSLTNKLKGYLKVTLIFLLKPKHDYLLSGLASSPRFRSAWNTSNWLASLVYEDPSTALTAIS